MLRYDGEGALDLTGFTDSQISGIESVDITGSGDTNLSLGFQDLLDMTEVDNTLTIVGNTGDTVAANLSGHTVETQDMGAFTRYVIDGGVAQLDIDNDIQQNIQTDLA